MLTITEAANELKLSFLKENHPHLMAEYQARGLTFEEALLEWINEEVQHRRNRSHQRRIKQAKFSQKNYLIDFDDQVFNEPVRKELRSLKTLQFIQNK